MAVNLCALPLQAGLGAKLDMIDAGDEGQALMQIEEEAKVQKEQEAGDKAEVKRSKSLRGGDSVKRLMPVDDLDEESAALDDDEHAALKSE